MRGVEECYRGKHVRVFRRDQAATVERLRRAATRMIAERDDVLEVRLFGSLARGDAGPASDADLLIVVREGAPPFLERSPSLARYFEGAGIGCDVFVYTESEVASSSDKSIVKTALDTGERLASHMLSSS